MQLKAKGEGIPTRDCRDYRSGKCDFSELTESASAFEGSEAVPGRRFNYGYDAIGNRKYAVVDEWNLAVHENDYTSNALNQYTQRETGTGFSVSGFIKATDESRGSIGCNWRI